MKKDVTPEITENFIQIPHSVLYDTRLPERAKLIFGMILSLTRLRGHCFATNTYFAEKLGCSSSTVSNSISLLRKLSYIDIFDPSSFRRKIRVSSKTSQKLEADVLENSEVDSEILDTTSEEVMNTLPAISQHKIEGNKEEKILKKEEKLKDGKAKRLPFIYSPSKVKELKNLLSENFLPLSERVGDFFDQNHHGWPYSVNSLFVELIGAIQISAETCKVLNENTFENFLCDQILFVLDNRSERLKKKEKDISYHRYGEAFGWNVEVLGNLLQELLEIDLNGKVINRGISGITRTYS